MTSPPDPSPDLLKCARRLARLGLSVPGIPIWILLEFGWISGTLLASDVVTVYADLLPTSEFRTAFVAGTVYPLSDILPNEILPSTPRRDRKLVFLLWFLGSSRNDFLALFLWLLRRITRTFLAAAVSTADASLLNAKGSLTMMACTVDSHPDGLLNAFTGFTTEQWPFAKVKVDTILLKESLSLLMIKRVPCSSYRRLSLCCSGW